MISRPTRRRFLELSGTAAGMAGVPVAAARYMTDVSSIQTAVSPPRPKIAALASTYYYLSHAYHIVGRFLDGFVVHDGHGLHKPPFDIASVFIEQVAPATDLGRAHAAAKHVRLSPTIADALTLGTGKLAVDGVLLIAEHGEFPYNEKLQKLYPRGRFFREVLEVIRASGTPVPVFIDKHLSYSRAEASEMVAQAKALHIPLMAGSSLPVTWRFPALEIPLERDFKEVLVASRGDLEIYGFHAARDGAVHGRAAQAKRQVARRFRRHLPGGRCRLDSRRPRSVVLGAARSRPGPQSHSERRRYQAEHTRLHAPESARTRRTNQVPAPRRVYR